MFSCECCFCRCRRIANSRPLVERRGGSHMSSPARERSRVHDRFFSRVHGRSAKSVISAGSFFCGSLAPGSTANAWCIR